MTPLRTAAPWRARQGVIAPSAAGAMLAAGVFLGMYRDGSAHVIERTERGFEPSRLTVKKGDTVTFTSEAATFWPASDSHPTHARYSAFDPGRLLEPGEEWMFTFDKAGVWAFHDHASPQFGGVIVVEGEAGESVEECLRAYTSTIQPECWAGEVGRVVREEGVANMLPRVREWYAQSPDFQRNCHDVMHLVGVAAYQEYMRTGEAVDGPEVIYCGYGFYHGFVEEMLRTQGFSRFEDVEEYCGAVRAMRRNPNGYGPCLHGIGHAVVDSLDSATWGDARGMAERGLAVCEKLLEGEFERVRCGSGVFNAIANAYSARDYELSYDDIAADPLALCRVQREEYHSFCAMEIGHGFLRDRGWEREEEMAYIRALEPQMRGFVISAYAENEAKRTIDSIRLEAMRALCDSFSDIGGTDACVEGAVTGLFALGKPGDDAGLARTFCDSLERPVPHEACARLPR